MTDTSTSDSDSGTDWYRLNDETTKAQLYPHEDHKDEWQEEAEAVGQSLSQYLYDLVQEARAYREGDMPIITSKDERVPELESRIEELQNELDQARQRHQTGSKLSISDLVEQELSEQYKTVDEILEFDQDFCGSLVTSKSVASALEPGRFTGTTRSLGSCTDDG